MKFKEGVKLNGSQPEIALALIVCDGVYKAYGQNMVVTSVTDGVHSRGSLHYVGFAFDLRTRDTHSQDLVRIHKDLLSSLTEEFDVVLEKDHFHVEFQPK